jgi:hypothetical protein
LQRISWWRVFVCSAGCPQIGLVKGDWQGEPGAAIEQSVDVGAADLCDVGTLSTELGEASAESGNVPVHGVDVGAVIPVAAGAVQDPQGVEVA